MLNEISVTSYLMLTKLYRFFLFLSRYNHTFSVFTAKPPLEFVYSNGDQFNCKNQYLMVLTISKPVFL